MNIELFKHIAERLARHDRFFQQRRNAAGELRHSTCFKMVTAALRMLAYGIPADVVDDHLPSVRVKRSYVSSASLLESSKCLVRNILELPMM